VPLADTPWTVDSLSNCASPDLGGSPQLAAKAGPAAGISPKSTGRSPKLRGAEPPRGSPLAKQDAAGEGIPDLQLPPPAAPSAAPPAAAKAAPPRRRK
jgi:hypothetical protein